MTAAEATRPDDRELLRAALRGFARSAGIPVLYGGLIDRNALTITELFGTNTDSLRGLWVQSGEGVGGSAFERAKPTIVADYVRTPSISHHHDEVVRMEGLRSMLAVPVLVDHAPRAVLYAATREHSALGEQVADHMDRLGRAIAGEIRVRDEVDRRVSLIRSFEPRVDAEERDIREAVRVAHAELVALAGSTDDTGLAKSILAITDRLTGRGDHAGAPGSATQAPLLTRRESDVLAQVALGCSYPEVARRLTLKPDTVKGYMQVIIRKLGVHSRHEAVATARRLGLLP